MGEIVAFELLLYLVCITYHKSLVHLFSSLIEDMEESNAVLLYTPTNLDSFFLDFFKLKEMFLRLLFPSAVMRIHSSSQMNIDGINSSHHSLCEISLALG